MLRKYLDAKGNVLNEYDANMQFSMGEEVNESHWTMFIQRRR